jgi:hypothetical protein
MISPGPISPQIGVTRCELVLRLTEMRDLKSPVLLVTILALTACGVEPGATPTTESPTTTVVVSSSTSAPTPTTIPSSTSTSAPASTTSTAAPSAGLPGTPVDFGPVEGDLLMVIGVRYDDVLNLRAGPGTSQAIIGTIPPTNMGLVAFGETRELPGAFWVKVSHGEKLGWVHLGFVGYAGGVEDVTAEVIDDLGETPSADTMVELGLIVAEAMASEDPPSEIVRVTPVVTGDLHEVTYDVIGFGDDSVRGVRLHVFGQASGSGFTLKSIEMMVICGRGVDDGTCV